MKTIILIFTLMLSLGLYAQVGINTNDPKSTLDVEGEPTNTNVVDGLLIPRLSISQLEAKQTQYGLDQNGTIVFIDDATGGSSVTPTGNIIGPGLYYWDNSASLWKAVGGSADDLYWDRDAGNGEVILANIDDDVGIGSTSPDSKLDVQADVPLIRTTDNDNPVSSTNMYGGIAFAGSGGTLSSVIVVPVGNNDLVVKNNQTGSIRFQTDGPNDRMIVDENGDVGIGTNSPQTTFEVDNGTSTSEGVLFTGEYDGSSSVPDLGEGSRLMWFPGKAAFRVGRTGGLNPTSWDDANVGTTSIGIGFNTVASANQSIALGNQTEATGSSSFAVNDNSVASGNTSFASGQATEASGLQSTAMGTETVASGSRSMALGRDIEVSGDNSFAIGLEAGGTEEVTADNTMAIMGGNVGIGTTDAGMAPLVINNDEAWDPGGNNDNVDNLYLQNFRGDGEGNIGGSISFSGPANGGGNDQRRHAAITGIQTDGSESDHIGLAFFTHNSIVSTGNLQESMRLTHDGNLGIGEEDPDGNLHIYDDTGNTFVDVRSDDGEETGMRLRENVADQIGVDLFYDGSQNSFFIDGVDGSGNRNGNVFTFERNGNVGIGTVDPTQELEIGDYTNPEDIRLSGADNDDNSGRIVFSETAGVDKAAIAYNSLSNNLEFRNDQDGTVMTLERGSGNVGIGTDDPDVKLQIDPASISGFNSQSFEGITGSWTTTAPTGESWEFDTDQTTSNNTGPDGPSDGSEYIYTETSGTSSGDVFQLEQTFDFSGRSGVTFSFDYHMYFDGATDGTLELIVNGSTEFTVTGQQQVNESDPYSTANVDLSAFDNQSGVTIAINFTTGSQSATFEYDLAIDNIQIQENLFSGGTVLQVGQNGDGSVAEANAWNTFSDKRWKKDIEQLPEVMEKIEKINGYYYKWKEGSNDKSRQIGVIAQEIREVFPEAVNEDADGYLSVDYSKLTAPLIEAVKTLSKKVNNQKLQINQLQEQNDKQEALIEEVSLRVQRLEGKE